MKKLLPMFLCFAPAIRFGSSNKSSIRTDLNPGDVVRVSWSAKKPRRMAP